MWTSCGTNRTGVIFVPYSPTYPIDLKVTDTVNWISKLKLDLTFLYFDEPVIEVFKLEITCFINNILILGYNWS